MAREDQGVPIGRGDPSQTLLLVRFLFLGPGFLTSCGTYPGTCALEIANQTGGVIEGVQVSNTYPTLEASVIADADTLYQTVYGVDPDQVWQTHVVLGRVAPGRVPGPSTQRPSTAPRGWGLPASAGPSFGSSTTGAPTG